MSMSMLVVDLIGPSFPRDAAKSEAARSSAKTIDPPVPRVGMGDGTGQPQTIG
jgi:hypothetical protein